MESLNIKKTNADVMKLMELQGLTIAVIVCTFLSISNLSAAFSALLGGLICLLSTFSFGKIFLLPLPQNKLLSRLYWAASSKWLISVALFTAFILLLHKWHLSFWPFFISYAIVQNTFWISPLFLRTENVNL